MAALENTVPSHLLKIGESFESGYKAILDFDGWRVAMLRHSDATDRDRFNRIEKHNETHEVFILTEGEAHLIVAGIDPLPEGYFVLPMRRNVAYNVLPGVWHHVVLSESAHIILFEKSNTSRDNSGYHFPDSGTMAALREKIRIFNV
jgi:hypothetical protein